MTTFGEPRIEYMPLSAISPALRNPRKHALDALGGSIARFGLVATPIMNEASGRLVAGHGRIEALAASKARGADPPRYVRVDGSEWLVPVQRGVSFADEREAEAYLLADNRQAELAAWDVDIVALLREHESALEGIGYVDEDIAALSAKLDGFIPADEVAGEPLPAPPDGSSERLTVEVSGADREAVHAALQRARTEIGSTTTGALIAHVCRAYLGA